MATPAQSSTEAKTISDIIPIPAAELPRERGWMHDEDYMYLFNGFWQSTVIINGLLALQQHFKPHPNDVLLASYPKSGTTWLKALLFSILNRATYNVDDHDGMHPLLTSNPHELVPWLEIYASRNPTNPRPETSFFQTHIGYQLLPEQIRSSSCRIVYVFRDPKDVLVSYWHYIRNRTPKEFTPISLQEAFDKFSRGSSPGGPYWDHVTGYYKASIQFPDKVYFVRYEDLKTETVVHVKKLAEFLGQPFSAEEENEGVAQKITDLCSFERLSNLEVNKYGTAESKSFSGKTITLQHNWFFRKGEIGDSKNHLSEEMMEVLDRITEEKFKEVGLPTLLPPIKTTA